MCSQLCGAPEVFRTMMPHQDIHPPSELTEVPIYSAGVTEFFSLLGSDRFQTQQPRQVTRHKILGEMRKRVGSAQIVVNNTHGATIWINQYVVSVQVVVRPPSHMQRVQGSS